MTHKPKTKDQIRDEAANNWAQGHSSILCAASCVPRHFKAGFDFCNEMENEALKVAVETLEEIKSKVGMCIFGSAATSSDPDEAFRQGSYYAWCDTGHISKDALDKIHKLMGES
jgi:hypothetical protein